MAKLKITENEYRMMLWINVMRAIRISPAGVARTLLRNLDSLKPLNSVEAAAVRDALEKSGVNDATNRLAAGFSRIILKQVT